jgi:hypothetical protein
MAQTWDVVARRLANTALKSQRRAQKYLTEADPRLASRKYSRAYGVNRALDAYKGYLGQALKTQGLLKNLEGNINTRAQGAGMSEALRSKLYATEQAPLSKQYANLMSSAQTAQTGYEQARQRWQDAMDAWSQRRQARYEQILAPYTSFEKVAPLLQEAHTYKPPVQYASSGSGSSRSSGGSRTYRTTRTVSGGGTSTRKTNQSFKNALQNRARSDLSNILSGLLGGKKKKKSTSGFGW